VTVDILIRALHHERTPRIPVSKLDEDDMTVATFADRRAGEGSGRVADILSRIKVHDVDTHITEPADLFTSRMPAKWGDRIPHVAYDPAIGAQRWFVNNVPGPRGFGLVDIDEETRAGGWDPHARLRWMDRHGVYSQVLYPNLVAFFPIAFMSGDPDWSVDCV
jgi:hypothetical protein